MTIQPLRDTRLLNTESAWRQRGYRDGRDGWEMPWPGALPQDVPEEFKQAWWVGYRRGREARTSPAD